MFIYLQSSGKLLRKVAADYPVQCGSGYSGHGAGVNNSAMEMDPDVGPLPRGFYVMEEIKDANGNACDYEGKKAPVIRLVPDGANEMFGRSGFLIHGDMVSAPGQEQASKGCMIMPLAVRQAVAASTDKILQVI